MSYHAINIVTYETQYPLRTGRRVHTVRGETVAGLEVHPAHYDNPWTGRPDWVVSNRAGLGICRCNSRREARARARQLSPLMPDEVRSGEWDGRRWIAENPDAATMFQRIMSKRPY